MRPKKNYQFIKLFWKKQKNIQKTSHKVFSKILFMVLLLLPSLALSQQADITPLPQITTPIMPSSLPELKAAYQTLSQAYKMKMIEFQNQLTQLTRTYQISVEQLAQLQAQFDNLTQDYQALKQLSETLETQSSQLTDNFQQLTQQYLELKNSIDSLIALTDSLKSLSDQLQKQNEFYGAVVGYIGWGLGGLAVLEVIAIALHFVK